MTLQKSERQQHDDRERRARLDGIQVAERQRGARDLREGDDGDESRAGRWRQRSRAKAHQAAASVWRSFVQGEALLYQRVQQTTHARSGWPRRGGERSAPSRCRRRPRTRSSSARCSAASAAAPRRSCFEGRVPASEQQRMRAPFQAGEFPAPVKYGYASVGRVERGPRELQDRVVFALYPHQTRYVVPAAAVHVLPDGVPPERAVLAANLETAINGLWDARPHVGDRISVIGGGTVGCLVAWLAGRMPGCDVELVDTNPARARGRPCARRAVRCAGARDGRRRRRHSRERIGGGPRARAARRRVRSDDRRDELVRRPASSRCRSAKRFTRGG